MRKILSIILCPFGFEVIKSLKVKRKFRHSFTTLAYSNDYSECNAQLIELVSKSIVLANEIEIDFLTIDVNSADAKYFNVFPGEHYRLLKALAIILNPNKVIEIGTFTGMGCVALMQGLSSSKPIHTFDIKQWKDFQSHLKESDFESGSVVQHLGDLSSIEYFKSHQGLFEEAELIFCDGPKDGKFERVFLQNLSTLKVKRSKKFLVLDDIKFPNMIDLWVSIKSPKLDITSFGHFSGTGIIDISEGLQLS